jgi:hypothetical protein
MAQGQYPMLWIGRTAQSLWHNPGQAAPGELLFSAGGEQQAAAPERVNWVNLLFLNQTYLAFVEEVVPGPVEYHHQPVAESDQTINM